MLNTVLSNEQIQTYAPSAFAGQAYQGQSDRYAFVPTSAVIDGMRSAGFLPVNAMQSRCRLADKSLFTKHMIRFRQSDAQLSVVGDSVLETVLVNSHDGTSAYNLSMGMFRLACLNGLMVSEGLVASVHVRHVGNIIEQIVQRSTELLQNAPVIAETVKQWKTIDLSKPEQHILAEEAHGLRFDGESNLAGAISPDKLLTARRYDDNGSDLWSTFNRIQENTIKGGLRGFDAHSNRVRSREVKGIDQNVRLNRALWSLAEKMAQLKAA
jgi:hypothetical protein